jgi:hypothetical protein
MKHLPLDQCFYTDYLCYNCKIKLILSRIVLPRLLQAAASPPAGQSLAVTTRDNGSSNFKVKRAAFINRKWRISPLNIWGSGNADDRSK